MDTVLSYHMNPLTCGIARFNAALSRKLDLPFLQLFSSQARLAKRPLLSMKISEFTPDDVECLNILADDDDIWPRLRLFFHDYNATPIETKLMRRAEVVYCGNEALYTEINEIHNNVVLAWCPGFLFDTRPFDKLAEISVYTFGMAHKLRADYFYLLRDLLDGTGKSYAIYVSAAVHEGKSLDDNFTSAYDQLVECFGENVRFLGFISDGALYNYLTDTSYFAAFFQNGVRANNTSVSTAMQCGAVVLTNLDAQSPPQLVHMENVVDIRQCRGTLPADPEALQKVRDGGRQYAASMGWNPLIDLFTLHENGLP